MKDRRFVVNEDGSFIGDENFDFDAGFKVTGDFGSAEDKKKYSLMIADVLNGVDAHKKCSTIMNLRFEPKFGRNIAYGRLFQVTTEEMTLLFEGQLSQLLAFANDEDFIIVNAQDVLKFLINEFGLAS